MSQDYKVVPFTSGGVNQPHEDASPQMPLPAPLAAVRDRAVTYLRVGLHELFDNADDTLFEKADRASNNADQSLFFDAMRLIRLRRHAIEKTCCERMEREFGRLQNPRPFPSGSPVTYSVDTLSLVQPDELEQTVALDSMASRVSSRNQLALAQLTTRLNSLVKAPVSDSSNPLGGAVMVQIFSDSCVSLNLDIKIRLLIFKMFERYVLNHIDSLHGDANELLINAGILPDLTQGGIPARQRLATGVSRHGVLGEQPAPGGQEVLSLFSELIGTWRHGSGDLALNAQDASAAAAVHSDELLGMLAAFASGPSTADHLSLKSLRKHLQQRLNEDRQQTGEVRKLDRVDEDVISLVSMLFDFMLDDADLPAALKVLIGRMQLPILRVAIADKSFFSCSSHPARRLLNELARATMSWSDRDDLRHDHLHALLEKLVERMLRESIADTALFEQLHTELAEFVRIDQRRAERLAQRTKEAEEGRARVSAARSTVAGVLNELMLGKTLSVFAVDLLRDTWSQVMQITILRQGKDSAAWGEAVITAQRLVQSLDASSTGVSIEQQAFFNASVCRDLCNGLSLLGEEDPQHSPLLSRLRQLQGAVLDCIERAGRPGLAADQSDTIRVLEPVLAEQSAEEDATPPNVDAVSWVASLHAGSWFELAGRDGKQGQRAKLAAVISFSGKYIFVNGGGMKVAEFSRSALTHHYAQGLIRLLADDQLFDRALESVIGNLRQLHRART